MTALPIACTLSAEAYADRTASIAELNEQCLLRHEWRDRTLILVYRPDAAPRMREIVEGERRCCAFLEFEETAGDDEFVLRVTAPESAGDAARALLDPFVAGAGPSHPVAGDRVATAAAVTSATATIACGVCCVVPFAFPAVGLTGAGAVAAAFANAYGWMRYLSLAGVISGWLWVGRDANRRRQRPSRATLRAMTLATSLLVVAWSWPLLEPHVRALFRR